MTESLLLTLGHTFCLFYFTWEAKRYSAIEEPEE